MDPIVAAAIAYASTGGIEKLLGPSFEYMGEGLRNTIEKLNVSAKENIGKIIGKAINKKSSQLDEDGRVNPRIIKDIVIEGAFCDTNILQEYYSGILIGARTIDGDDSDIFYLNIVKGLSTDQLRLHYVIYSKFLNTYKGEVVNLHQPEEKSKYKVIFNFDELSSLFGLTDSNKKKKFASQTIPALYSSGLVTSYDFDLKKDAEQFEFSYSLIGVSLFLRVLGYPEIFSPTCLSDELLGKALKNVISYEDL